MDGTGVGRHGAGGRPADRAERKGRRHHQRSRSGGGHRTGRPIVAVAQLERPSLADSILARQEAPAAEALTHALASVRDLGVGRLTTAAPRSMTVRDIAMQTLEHNLALHLQRSGIARDIARQVLLQAQALFRPVLTVSFNADYAHGKTRILRDEKFKKALVPCSSIAGMPAQYAGQWYKYFGEGPILALVYANPHPEGYYDSRIEANQGSTTFDATGYAIAGFLSQRLP